MVDSPQDAAPSPASKTSLLDDERRTSPSRGNGNGEGGGEGEGGGKGEGEGEGEGQIVALNQLMHPIDASAQWLFSQSDMSDTPSVLVGGLDEDQERISRWKGIQLLFSIGDYMRLHNHVTTTASILFHRFFMRKAMPKDPRERTFDTFPFFELAPTCIFLACKVEETHRKLHHVIEATMAVLDRSPQGQELAEARAYQANKSSREYGRWKDLILLNEERLLEALCFDLIIEQAHPIAIKAAKRLGAPRSLAQLTVIYCNCLLYGAVCTFYDAPILAACAFARACEAVEVDPARFSPRPRPDGKGPKAWYDVFGVDEDEIEEAKDDVNTHMLFHEERLQASSSGRQQQPGSTPHHHQPPSAPRSNLTTPLGSHGETDSPRLPLSGSIPGSALHTTPRPPTLSPPPLPVPSAQMESKHQVSFLSPPLAASNGRQSGNDGERRPPSRHGSKGSGPPPPLMGAPRRAFSSESKEGKEAEEGHEAKQDVEIEKLEQEQQRTEDALQREEGEESAEEGEV